jgi:hypothetical protein
MTLLLEVTAQGQDFALLETKIEELMASQSDVTLHEGTSYDVTSKSSLWQTLVLGASSSAGFAALRSIVVEVIRSRRISVVIRQGKKVISYEGPISDENQLRRLGDAITTDDTSARGRS